MIENSDTGYFTAKQITRLAAHVDMYVSEAAVYFHREYFTKQISRLVAHVDMYVAAVAVYHEVYGINRDASEFKGAGLLGTRGVSNFQTLMKYQYAQLLVFNLCFRAKEHQDLINTGGPEAIYVLGDIHGNIFLFARFLLLMGAELDHDNPFVFMDMRTGRKFLDLFDAMDNCENDITRIDFVPNLIITGVFLRSILLGDVLDEGPFSSECALIFLYFTTENLTKILGNHEIAALQFAFAFNPGNVRRHFFKNGATECLVILNAVLEAIEQKRIITVKSMKLYGQDYVFSHAALQLCSLAEMGNCVFQLVNAYKLGLLDSKPLLKELTQNIGHALLDRKDMNSFYEYIKTNNTAFETLVLFTETHRKFQKKKNEDRDLRWPDNDINPGMQDWISEPNNRKIMFEILNATSCGIARTIRKNKIPLDSELLEAGYNQWAQEDVITTKLTDLMEDDVCELTLKAIVELWNSIFNGYAYTERIERNSSDIMRRIYHIMGHNKVSFTDHINTLIPYIFTQKPPYELRMADDSKPLVCDYSQTHMEKQLDNAMNLGALNCAGQVLILTIINELGAKLHIEYYNMGFSAKLNKVLRAAFKIPETFEGNYLLTLINQTVIEPGRLEVSISDSRARFKASLARVSTSPLTSAEIIIPEVLPSSVSTSPLTLEAPLIHVPTSPLTKVTPEVPLARVPLPPLTSAEIIIPEVLPGSVPTSPLTLEAEKSETLLTRVSTSPLTEEIPEALHLVDKKSDCNAHATRDGVCDEKDPDEQDKINFILRVMMFFANHSGKIIVVATPIGASALTFVVLSFKWYSLANALVGIVNPVVIPIGIFSFIMFTFVTVAIISRRIINIKFIQNIDLQNPTDDRVSTRTHAKLEPDQQIVKTKS